MRNTTKNLFILFCLLLSPVTTAITNDNSFDLFFVEKQRILDKASVYSAERPVTVTAYKAKRSAGGIRDFYSEGDYWWPDPDNPQGPYVRRDGLSNPDNFISLFTGQNFMALRKRCTLLGRLAGASTEPFICRLTIS